MNRSASFSERLKSYSILAGSMLASSVAVRAQVVYTDIEPDIKLGGVVPSIYPDFSVDSIDLNNDGVYDFRITLGMYGTNPTEAGYSFRERIEGIDIQNNAVMTYSIEYSPWALKLDCDDNVPLFYYFYGLWFANLNYQFGDLIAYHWINQVDKHIGLKIKVDGNFHYGWVRLDVNTMGLVPNIVIKSYAYEATPNTKIAVCDTGFGVGIADETGWEKQFSIAPNPSEGAVVIQLAEPLSQEAEITVSDASGRTVWSHRENGGTGSRQLAFDLAMLPQGLYFIELKTENGTAVRKWVHR